MQLQHRHLRLGELPRTLHSGTTAMAVHRSEVVAIMVEQAGQGEAGVVITKGQMEEM